MDITIWLTFVAASLITTFSPGPAVLLAVSNSISFGVRNALASSAGNVTGIFLVSSAAVAGLGVVLHTSSLLFLVMKVVGAAYLIYLGVRQWKSKINIFDRQVHCANSSKQQTARFFTQGLLVAITNPKAILFFTALFPQFLKVEVSMPEQFLVFTSTFAGCAVVSHCLYVLLARRIKDWFSSSYRAALFNRISGGAFVILGIGLFRLKHNAG
jgi:threonine/homoserine/homoserine lactone efflux protein